MGLHSGDEVVKGLIQCEIFLQAKHKPHFDLQAPLHICLSGWLMYTASETSVFTTSCWFLNLENIYIHYTAVF